MKQQGILNLTVNLIIHSYSYDPYLPSEISFRPIEQKSIYQVQYTPYLDILDSHLPNSHNLWVYLPKFFPEFIKNGLIFRKLFEKSNRQKNLLFIKKSSFFVPHILKPNFDGQRKRAWFNRERETTWFNSQEREREREGH